MNQDTLALHLFWPISISCFLCLFVCLCFFLRRHPKIGHRMNKEKQQQNKPQNGAERSYQTQPNQSNKKETKTPKQHSTAQRRASVKQQRNFIDTFFYKFFFHFYICLLYLSRSISNFRVALDFLRLILLLSSWYVSKVNIFLNLRMLNIKFNRKFTHSVLKRDNSFLFESSKYFNLTMGKKLNPFPYKRMVFTNSLQKRKTSLKTAS